MLAAPVAPRYRRAVAADLPALAALYALCARTLGPQVYTPAQVAAWQSFGVVGPAFRAYVLEATTWVAETAGRVDGFCGVAASGEVHSLYVRPDLSRQGHGSRLLGHALARAQDEGCHRFQAWATPFSLPVFERAGFVLRERVQAAFQGVVFERCRVARG